MFDYYPFLLRSVQLAGSDDQQARRAVYVRAWQIVTDQLRARRPPVSADEVRAHRSAMQAAIGRIEREYSQAVRAVASGRTTQAQGPTVEIPNDRPIEAEVHPPLSPSRSGRGLWAVAIAAVVVMAIGVGSYFAWTATPHRPALIASTVGAATHEPSLRHRSAVTTSTADLAPGIDGGSTDADISYILRRQRVFYRTTFPSGTIVVDKPQHFMYLVMPNSAALRYPIGVGTACAELTGPRLISRKVEWPEWIPPPGSRQIKADPVPGGVGNPLGSRLLDLDDNVSRIHGTNAPKTVGEDVTLGCVRLVNDDVTDLYNRVTLGTRVVMR